MVKYKSLILFCIGIIIAYLLVKFYYPQIESLILNLSYFGIFINGMAYSFSITAPLSTAIFYFLGKKLNPFLLAFIGAFGSIFSDVVIYKFSKIILNDLKFLFLRDGGELSILEYLNFIKAQFYKTFIIIPLAILIIISPLPDELGVALLGSKIKIKNFVVLSFICNFIGIFIASAIVL